MNERIEALAKQAAEYAIEFAVKDQELYIPKLMEKFAELIVQDCRDVVNNVYHQTPLELCGPLLGNDESTVSTLGWFTGQRFLYRALGADHSSVHNEAYLKRSMTARATSNGPNYSANIVECASL